MDPGSTSTSDAIGALDEARQLRHEALLIVDREINAEAAIFFNAREVDGNVYLGASESIGETSIETNLQSMRDETVPPLLESVIRGPLPEDRDQFLTLHHRLELRGIDDLSAEVLPWAPRFGLSDWIGLLVYHGARFVGWIGAWRVRSQEPFSPTECDQLNGQIEAIRPLLVDAHQCEQQSRRDQAGFILFTHDGTTSHASAGLKDWLDDQRRADLLELITDNPRDTESGPYFFAGMRITITPLHGLNTHRAYLMRLMPARYPRIEPEAVLTPSQKEVARLATTGATVEEMARMLHRSPHTVKTHLKHIYRRLDINSRVQLVELIDT